MLRGPEGSGDNFAWIGFLTRESYSDPYLEITYAGMTTSEETAPVVESPPNPTECGPTIQDMVGTSPGASDFGMFEAVEETVCSPD
jgi:hypothetical protein